MGAMAGIEQTRNNEARSRRSGQGVEVGVGPCWDALGGGAGLGGGKRPVGR